MGTIPVDTPLTIGTTIIFAGRRWTLTAIRDTEKLLIVTLGSSGTPTKLGGSGGLLHDKLVGQMRSVLSGSDNPPYLNAIAKKHLQEGRSSFRTAGLLSTSRAIDGDETYLFPWVGSLKLGTFQLALSASGIESAIEGLVAVRVKATEEKLTAALSALSVGDAFDPLDLADVAGNKNRNKFDYLLGDDLLLADFAADQIRTDALSSTASSCV